MDPEQGMAYICSNSQRAKQGTVAPERASMDRLSETMFKTQTELKKGAAPLVVDVRKLLHHNEKVTQLK